MTTNKGIGFAAISGITSIALIALAFAPAPAHADGVPGVADMAVVYSDGYMSMVDVFAMPGMEGTEAVVSADGVPVAGMTLMPGSNPMPLPAAATYVVTSVGSGDIAWATTAEWDQPGFE